MQEFPALEKVNKKYASQGLQVVAITSDDKASIARVRKRTRATFTVLLDGDSKTMEAYAVSAIPRTLLIDHEGIVRADITGAETAEELEARIRAIMGQKN